MYYISKVTEAQKIKKHVQDQLERDILRLK